MKTNNLFLLLSLAILCYMTTSCNDDKLAKEIAGSWTFSYSPENDEGLDEKIQETITFTYDDSNFDSGTFVERLDGVISNIEIEDTDGSRYGYSYHSSIKGKYKMVLGDLQITYYINTLKVNVYPSDISLDLDDQTKKGLIYLNMSTLEFKKQMAEEARQAILDVLHEQYAEQTEGVFFTDVQIAGTTMTFMSSDLGRVTLKKK